MAETVNEYNETDLGNVAPNPQGDYSETAEYEYLDLVAYAGGSYLCIKEDGTISGTAPTPGKTTEIWQEVSRPGNLTPEYVAMHDDVVNKAASVAEDAASVASDREQVEGMKENVASLQEQTAQDAQLAKEYRESAAGYASAAETSRTAAGESEENVRALVNGFDDHVEEQKTSAQEEITTSRQAAIKAIAAQQVSSVNSVKQEGQKAINKTNADAEATAADRAAVAEMAATIDSQASQVAQNAAQVAEDKVTAENYMQTAGESKKQALEAAERLKDSVNLVQKNTVDLQGKAPVIIGSATSYDGSPVEVNDSAEMQLQGLRLYGKSKQVVTTGKNLCSIKSFQLSTNMAESDVIPWTKKDRIYFSCDTEKVENSSIYIFIVYYDKNRKKIGANGAVNPCTGTRAEVIFSGKEAGANSTNVDLTIVEYVKMSVGLSNSSVQTSFIDNIMLCDEANQPYEPYTGGKPSPSPEYPQEIVSVGQKLSTGKNLVKIPDKEVGWAENIENITQITTLQNGYYVLSAKIELEQTLSEFNNTDICRISCFGGDGELIAQALKKWGDYTKRFLSIIITPDISLNKIKSVTLYGCGNDANGKTGMARFYDFQIEKGTEVTEYEPYTGGVPAPYRTDCGIEITGKNLLGLFDFHKCYVSETNKFVSDSRSVSYSCETKKLPEKIIFSGNNINRKNISYTNKKPEVGTLFDIVNVKENPITIKKEYKYVNIQVAYENTPDNVQIEKGTEATSYEPYKQSITTIPLPNGLPGIPVTTGGNYTDENGQQYICDEIDFKRGKYVRRVWQAEFDGSSDEKWVADVIKEKFIIFVITKDIVPNTKIMCNLLRTYDYVSDYEKGVANNSNGVICVFDDRFSTLDTFKSFISANPLIILAILKNPIETDLSEAQIQAYKSFTTFKPTSIISNDAGAQMEVEYAADTKAYIDNKLQEIAQALVASASEAE